MSKLEQGKQRYARLDLDDERTPLWVAPDELLASPRTYPKSVSW